MIRVGPEGWTTLGHTRNGLPVAVWTSPGCHGGQCTCLITIGVDSYEIDHIAPGFLEAFSASLTREAETVSGEDARRRAIDLAAARARETAA